MVYDILCRTLIGAKHFRIRFDKINGFIRIHDGTIYLVLFRPGKYDVIFNRIKYLIGVKSGITYVIFHYFTKTKVDSYDSLPLEKKLTFHNVIILIKSVFDELLTDETRLALFRAGPLSEILTIANQDLNQQDLNLH